MLLGSAKGLVRVHKGCVQVVRHIQKHWGKGRDFALLLGSAQGLVRVHKVARHIQKQKRNGGDFQLLLGSAQGLLRVHKVCTGGQTYSEALDKWWRLSIAIRKCTRVA